MKRAFVLWIAISIPAHAYVREESNWNPRSLPISYRINTGSIPPGLGMTEGVNAVEGGFTTWGAPSCTTWEAMDAGTTTSSATTGDRSNVILWQNTWPAELGDRDTVIGITTPVWTVGGFFIDADIRFNNAGFTWNTTGRGGGVDAQSIATHEEGHFLGLGHSTTRGAVMLASYSSGLVRTLATDDTNGVCAIYPSGVASMDAGTPTMTDPCNAHGTTCDDCTPWGGCGFCGATNSCVTGTPTGPSAGTCASGYVWLQRDCAGMPTGSARFGDPCSSPSDCASGGICIGTRTGAFCSRVCGDDCGCPSGYACFGTSDPTINVCAPGVNDCAPDAGPPPLMPDGGTVIPPEPDAGNTIPIMPDSGTTMMMMTTSDSGSADMDAGVTADAGGTHRNRGACACSAPPHSSGTPIVLIFAGIALALASRKRRSK